MLGPQGREHEGHARRSLVSDVKPIRPDFPRTSPRVARVSHRYQPSDGGPQFRLGAATLFGEGLAVALGRASPATADLSRAFIIRWLYLSLGWTL